MHYTDSLKNTCEILGLDICFEEGMWPSSYYGEDFLNPNIVESKCLSGGGMYTT